MTVFEAYRRAAVSQVQPAMLVLAIVPVLMAAVLWIVLIWWKWTLVLAAIDAIFKAMPLLDGLSDRLVLYGVKVVPAVFSLWVLTATYIPLTLVTALGFISIAGMPIMTRHVAARDYPALERRRGGGLGGSLVNSFKAVIWFILPALLTFPLWFVPLAGPLIPALLLGRLNGRVLRYDALADHASADELARMAGAAGLRWGWLGFAGALLNLIPFFWFFSTTLTGLAFIHYALDALAAGRSTPLQESTP